MKAWMTGEVAGTGTFRCTACETELSMAAVEGLPTCPGCGGIEFVRTSLFTTTQNTLVELRTDVLDPGWVEDIRASLTEPGQYLAYRTSEGAIDVHRLEREWTRIGRSLAADVRFDDPTVSRRHALIVRGPDGLRVLDDRSLNGVFVNGERVEWSALADGDEVVIGRHHLRFLVITEVSGMRPAAPRPPPYSAAEWRRRSRSFPRRAAPVRRRRCGRSPMSCDGSI